MVHPLNTPRPKHALGGVLSKIRGEILRQAPGFAALLSTIR